MDSATLTSKLAGTTDEVVHASCMVLAGCTDHGLRITSSV